MRLDVQIQLKRPEAYQKCYHKTCVHCVKVYNEIIMESIGSLHPEWGWEKVLMMGHRLVITATRHRARHRGHHCEPHDGVDATK